MVAGWWLSPTPLKNDGVKVSWDDEIPNSMEKTCSKPPTSGGYNVDIWDT
jgi:hypothetical protein